MLRDFLGSQPVDYASHDCNLAVRFGDDVGTAGQVGQRQTCAEIDFVVAIAELVLVVVGRVVTRVDAIKRDTVADHALQSFCDVFTARSVSEIGHFEES